VQYLLSLNADITSKFDLVGDTIHRMVQVFRLKTPLEIALIKQNSRIVDNRSVSQLVIMCLNFSIICR